MEIRNNIGSFTSVRFPDETRVDEQERCLQCGAWVPLDALGEHRHPGVLVRFAVPGAAKDVRRLSTWG